VAKRIDEARDELAQRIRDQLASRAGVREMNMFGGVSFMVDDRLAVAAGTGGDLLVRVDPSEYDQLLTEGATPALMNTERPMGRGWMTAPSALLDDEAGLAYWVNVGINSRKA